MINKESKVPLEWQIKNDLILGLLVNPETPVNRLVEKLNHKYNAHREMVKSLVDATGFLNPEKANDFRQSLANFLYQETSIQIKGYKIDVETALVYGRESLKQSLQRCKDITFK